MTEAVPEECAAVYWKLGHMGDVIEYMASSAGGRHGGVIAAVADQLRKAMEKSEQSVFAVVHDDYTIARHFTDEVAKVDSS